MRNFAILVVALIMMATILTGCQKDELVQTPAAFTEEGLFLKSAQAGQTASASYFSNGKLEEFYYPDNLLFEVTPSSTAKVLNGLLEVKDYHVAGDEAFFLVARFGSKPMAMGEIGGKQIVDLNAENISAVRLPFTASDYSIQGEGSAKFNGLLKADHYVLAVNVEGGNLTLYDLQTGKKLNAKVTIKDDVLSSELGTLRFIKGSPVGNIFEFSTGTEKYTGYTLN
jgi:hypothetical protein